MSEFEPATVRLREDLAGVQWPEPQTIRSRGRERTVRQVTAAAALVIGLVAGFGIALLRPAAPAPTQPAGSSVPSASAPVDAILPADATIEDFTFVSPTVGWLLARTPCPSGGCPALVHTSDGGQHWQRLPAPPADVTRVRFATGQTGYAYSATALYLTRDGASTWVQQPGHADALEVANGTAVRIASTTTDCVPGCAYRIQRAPVGGTSWTTVASQDLGVPILLRTGHRAFAVFGHSLAAGVSAHAPVLTSADDGGTWTTHDDPCGTRGGVEAASQGLAVADDGSVTLLCFLRDGTGAFVITSIDGGTHFGPQTPTPRNALAVGAAGARTLFVSTLDGGFPVLHRSGDSGYSWTVVATAPDRLVQGDVPNGMIGFQNAHDGWWLPGGGTAFSTTDGGLTWTPHRLG